MEQEIVYCDFRHLTRQSREWFDFLQRKDIDEDTRMSGWPPLEDNRVAGCNYTNVMDPEGTIQHGEPHGLKIHIGEKAFKASSLLIGSLAQTKILTVWNKWKMTPRFTRVLAAELSVYESKAKLQAAEEEWDPLQKVHTLDTEGDPLLILVLEPIAPGRVRTTTGGATPLASENIMKTFCRIFDMPPAKRMSTIRAGCVSHLGFGGLKKRAVEEI